MYRWALASARWVYLFDIHIYIYTCVHVWDSSICSRFLCMYVCMYVYLHMPKHTYVVTPSAVRRGRAVSRCLARRGGRTGLICGGRTTVYPDANSPEEVVSRAGG